MTIKYDSETQKWFDKQLPNQQTTVVMCEKCGLFYKPSLGHKCDRATLVNAERMDKEFSKGFMQDLADLLDYCRENETDNLALEFTINGTVLVMDMTFSVRGGENDKK